MRRASLLSVMLASLAATGCARDRGREDVPVTAPPADQTFEVAREPQIGADTRFAAGQLAETQNNLAAAIAQYQEALRIDPDHTGSLFRLGVLYTSSRQFDSAIQTWNRYIEATNHAAGAYANLGHCLERAGHIDEAERAFQLGIKSDPSNKPCRVNYGLMLARGGRADEATAQLGAVLSPAETCYNLGSVYEQQGRPDLARREYEKALAHDPTFTHAAARLSAID